MKTDLSKILAVSGQSGLYLYISATRSGAVVEALRAADAAILVCSAKDGLSKLRNHAQ